jgi:competence protein ComEC
VLPLVAALVLHVVARRRGPAVLVTAGLVALACGVAAAKLRTEVVRAPVLQRQIGPVEVTGFVELIEPRPVRGQRITIRVAAIETLEAKQTPARVRVRVGIENADLEPGDAVRLRATLSPPPWPSLPGDYDFARAAWFQGLGAVGFATGAAAKIETDANAAPLSLRVRAVIERVRQAIGRRIVAALPGETGAIANALITGERGGITEATNQAFRDSGLFHILSISGLHMVIMAGAVFSLDPPVPGGDPRHCVALPNQEMGGGRGHAGRARLSADFRRCFCHRALLHHDLDHVPGGAAGSPGGGAA